MLLPNDLKILLSENGFAPNKETIYEIIAEYDLEETGGMSFKEFMTAMAGREKGKDSNRQLHHAFKKYDRKGKGYITLADLKEMSKLLGENDDEEMLTLMMTRASKTNATRISYQEFYEIMTSAVY